MGCYEDWLGRHAERCWDSGSFSLSLSFSFRDMGSKGRRQGKKVNGGRIGGKMMMGTQVVVQGRDVF